MKACGKYVPHIIYYSTSGITFNALCFVQNSDLSRAWPFYGLFAQLQQDLVHVQHAHEGCAGMAPQSIGLLVRPRAFLNSQAEPFLFVLCFRPFSIETGVSQP